MNIELNKLDDIYRQLVEIYESVRNNKILEYNIRELVELFEKKLYQLHGEDWMPSDLF